MRSSRLALVALLPPLALACAPAHAPGPAPAPTPSPVLAPPAAPARTPTSATVPMALEENRVFVDLDLRGPSGLARRVRTWVDTGGGGLMLTEAVARDLGLSRKGEPIHEGGEEYAPIEAPSMSLGGMQVELGRAEAMIPVGVREIAPASGAEAFLPARVLMQYDVVFDYPARTFTMARPGEGVFRGTRVPSPVQPDTGFVRVEVEIAGKTYGLLLDTGAAYTMASRTVLDDWIRAAPAWPRMTGAVLAANMIGKADLDALVMRIPRMTIGDLALDGVGFVARPPGTFERWMSPMMTAPIAGALAGNVLRTMRVAIDYAHGVTYLERGGAPAVEEAQGDLDSPGVVLDIGRDGTFRVAGIASRGGVEIPSTVRAGDRLLAIDGRDLAGMRRGAVFQALRGAPGDHHRLRVDRGGQTVEVEVGVLRLP